MRKISSLIGVVLLSMTLTACSSSEKTNQNEQTDTSQTLEEVNKLLKEQNITDEIAVYNEEGDIIIEKIADLDKFQEGITPIINKYEKLLKELKELEKQLSVGEKEATIAASLSKFKEDIELLMDEVIMIDVPESAFPTHNALIEALYDTLLTIEEEMVYVQVQIDDGVQFGEKEWEFIEEEFLNQRERKIEDYRKSFKEYEAFLHQ